MTAPLRLKGSVISGTGEAASFTRLDWVCRQCLQQLGFEPYPGTLNLRIAEGQLQILKFLQNQPGVELVPPTAEFCSSRALPVQVGGIACALILPERGVRVHDDAVVEIIAPLRLREALEIEDGDVVDILFRQPVEYLETPEA